MNDMVSVVMSAYNSVRFIREAIESILNQTYQDFELIIVDDGSTDETLPIAASYAERDSRVRVIRANHGGQSRARNTGIQHAQGDWVAIMDHDDVWLPQRLEKQLQAAAANPRVVAWGAYAYHLGPTGKISSVSNAGPVSEEEFYELRRREGAFTLSHASVLLRKEIVLRAGGYDPRLHTAEDMDLFDRMAEYGPVLAIPEPLLLYRLHTSSNTMKNFFRQRLLMRYVQARALARSRGERIPGLEDFIERERRARVLVRAKRRLRDTSGYYYRSFGIKMLNREYLSGLFFLAAALLLNPRYVLHRIWMQRLCSSSRQWLRSAALQRGEPQIYHRDPAPPVPPSGGSA